MTKNCTNHMIVRQYYREGLKYNYSVCLGGAWRGSPSPKWFVEWMEANIIFGAQQFMIHNMSISESLAPYVRYYVKLGLLEVLPWKFDQIITIMHTRSNLQLTLIFDCLYRMRRRTTYMVQIDQDELIVPRHPSDLTWDDMIRRSGCAPDTCVYGARQMHYGLRYPENVINANTSGLVMIDTTQRGTEVTRFPVRSKYVANAFMATSLSTHHASCGRSRSSCTLPLDVGANHHYRLNLLMDVRRGTIIDNSTLKYKDMLTRRVTEVMRLAKDLS